MAPKGGKFIMDSSSSRMHDLTGFLVPNCEGSLPPHQKPKGVL